MTQRRKPLPQTNLKFTCCDKCAYTARDQLRQANYAAYAVTVNGHTIDKEKIQSIVLTVRAPKESVVTTLLKLGYTENNRANINNFIVLGEGDGN